MKEHNSFFIVKRVLCVCMLILYVSGVQRFFGDSILSIAYIVLMFLVVIIMIPDILKEGKAFKQSPKTLLLIPLGLLMVILLDNLLMENIIQPILFKAVGVAEEDANTERVFGMIRKNPAVMVFLSCIFGPVLEEILYRYTVFGLIEMKSKPVAHFVTALLFGLQHVIDAGIYGGDMIQFINIGGYMMFSFIMSGLYSKTKNLCIPIAIHIMVNLFGVSMMLL